MTHFEIDLSAEEVVAFDEIFWRFVHAELFDESDPDVRLDAFCVGERERRVVTFGDRYHADAFERHWRLARPQRAAAPCALSNQVQTA